MIWAALARLMKQYHMNLGQEGQVSQGLNGMKIRTAPVSICSVSHEGRLASPDQDIPLLVRLGNDEAGDIQ
jgi:hypothetical protein